MTKRRYRAGRHWLWNAQMYSTPKKRVFHSDPIDDGPGQEYDDPHTGPYSASDTDDSVDDEE